ncbi:hypothetical protein GCM10027442_32760 [Emticicia fontis]
MVVVDSTVVVAILTAVAVVVATTVVVTVAAMAADVDTNILQDKSYILRKLGFHLMVCLVSFLYALKAP